MGDYLKRRATSLGIDVEGLIRTEEEIQAEQQQQQQMQMMDKAIPAGASAAGKMANENPEQLQAMAGAMQQGMQQ
jgi:hypothetical protein